MKKVVATGKTVEEAIESALKELETTRDNVETKVLELPSNGIMGLFRNKLAKVEVTKVIDVCKIAEEFLRDVTKSMGLVPKFNISLSDNVMNIVIRGDDMGILIGRRGQTLDSLQYLTNLAVNKYTDDYVRVCLDTENYREKREEALRELAIKLAKKVERTHRKIELEPMKPNERRIIHSTLQNNNKIHTYSKGEEPYRRIVIDFKRKENR